MRWQIRSTGKVTTKSVAISTADSRSLIPLYIHIPFALHLSFFSGRKGCGQLRGLTSSPALSNCQVALPYSCCVFCFLSRAKTAPWNGYDQGLSQEGSNQPQVSLRLPPVSKGKVAPAREHPLKTEGVMKGSSKRLAHAVEIHQRGKVGQVQGQRRLCFRLSLRKRQEEKCLGI